MQQTPVSLLMKEKLNKAFDEVAANPWLFAVDPKRDFTRVRKMPPKELLRFLFGVRGNSLNKELYDFFKEREEHMTASAFVQQRAKLLPEACSYIFSSFNSMCVDSKTYKGYHLYAVDGTDVTFAKDESGTTYMPNGGGGKDFNQYHVNALYDLMNRTYKDAIVQPKPSYDERKAALLMAAKTHLGSDDLLIADRGYSGYNFFEHLNRQGVKYLVRIRNTEWTEVASLPNESFDKDMEVELRTGQTNEDQAAFAAGHAKWISGPSKYGKEKKQISWEFESPFLFKYRCVRFEIGPGNWETIVTNLDRFRFPAEEIKNLYHLRWGIETSFRELKYALGLVNFHARKEEFILQEIYARLTMYNFCERIISAVVILKTENKRTKYDQAVNHTMGVNIALDFFRCHTPTGPPIESKIARYVLPVRPGRKDKRKIRVKGDVSFIYRVA